MRGPIRSAWTVHSRTTWSRPPMCSATPWAAGRSQRAATQGSTATVEGSLTSGRLLLGTRQGYPCPCAGKPGEPPRTTAGAGPRSVGCGSPGGDDSDRRHVARTAEQRTASSEAAPSDRIWTVPNLLSALRLPRRPGLPLLDARHRAGRPGDPAAHGRGHQRLPRRQDRPPLRPVHAGSASCSTRSPTALYILATLLALVARDGLPLWWALALISRDVFLGLFFFPLRRRGYGPPPRALPRQGRHVQPALRLPDAAGRAARARRPARPPSSGRSAGRSPRGAAPCTGTPGSCTSCRCVRLLRDAGRPARAGSAGERRREGGRHGGRRGHPPAPHDGQPAQAAPAGREPADHGARPAAAEAPRLRRDRRDRAVPRQPGPHLLRRRRRARDAPVVRDRGDPARHRRAR